jgi:hypothetical protein
VAIVSAQTNLSHFKEGFERQFEADRALGRHVLQVLDEYFGRNISPGMLVYEEFLVADSPIERDARQQVAQEIERSHQLMKTLLPS